MDPFTQRMLERTKLRRQKLDQHLSKDFEMSLRQPLQEKNDLNFILVEDNYQNDATMKQNFQTDNTLESKKHATDENIVQYNKTQQLNNNDTDCCKNPSTKQHKFGRLAELATKIREWEDELDKSKQPTFFEKSRSCNKEVSVHNEKGNEFIKSEMKKNEKQLIWDNAIIKSLESQGYLLSKNESRLIYDFKNEDETDSLDEIKCPQSPCNVLDSKILPKKVDISNKNCGDSPRLNKDAAKDSVVLKKAAFFEAHNKSSPVKQEKDPAELTVSERKALFEKNGGIALMPKVPISMPLPAKFVVDKCLKYENKSLDGVKSKNIIENNQITKLGQKMDDKSEIMSKVPVLSESESKVKVQKEKFEKGLYSTKPSHDNSKIMGQDKELNFIRNQPDNYKNDLKGECCNVVIPKPPPMLSLTEYNSKNLSDTNNDCKKNDAERLYPNLSEFVESTDLDEQTVDTGSSNNSKCSNIYLSMSFSDILEAKKNDPSSSNEHSFESELRESQVLSKMDEYLDNALNELSSNDDDFEEQTDNENTGSPSKILKSSSFEYKTENVSAPANQVVHTVSFYRKQQQNSVNTPKSIQKIKREEIIMDNTIVEDEEVLVDNKIQDLVQEINKQQTIISQASQALNLCLSTVEFSGSGEQVESERLLLLANHKRQACLNEVQRLKIEKTIRPRGCNQQLTERGDVVISNISIPLKRDALRAMAAVESMQYLVCLIKSDERVISTPAVPATRDNLKNTNLCFPGQYKLEKLFSDFKVTIEVYNLELNKEMLPHEIKYHINSKKEKKLLTPIKSKKTDSKLIMPHIQSPAGPNAVRSSNFHLCGYIVFSLREVTRTNWTLNKVPYTSPLEGSFSMKVQSQLQLEKEFRGFLTMFDDISGFGAWHRRWCLLSSYTLSYWKYPDDETRKVPIGTIDLRSVVTENVGLVSRDICARLHTFLLETTRPREEEDKESLVLHLEEQSTKIRHLLSADSREEMLIWCRKLNTTLALLRSWQCNFDS